MGTVLKFIGGWIIGNFLVKLFSVLGIAFITYQGLSSILDGLLGQLTAMVGGVGSDLHAILAMVGVWEGLSIIAGALLGIAAIKSIRVFVGSSS